MLYLFISKRDCILILPNVSAKGKLFIAKQAAQPQQAMSIVK